MKIKEIKVIYAEAEKLKGKDCIGGWEKMSCDIVEEYPCTCKKDGLLREKELMLIHHANLNTNNPIDL